jgi:hypothetical protein
LRPKSSKWNCRFWGPIRETGTAGFGAQIEKPSTLVLRLNQETYTPHLHVHSVDRTRRHLPSRSPGHRVSDLSLTIPDPLQQVSYSCHDHRRYPPCRTCHLHTMRQANMIFHINKGIVVKPPKCPRFEFKPWHVNDSSHIKPRCWPLGFSISHLMSSLTTKGIKFEV